MANERKAAFDSFGQYMQVKTQKLRQQHEEDRVFARVSNIFEGITVWVDGYVEPSMTELKHLIGIHGGGFEYYYSKERVTHIIATNLTKSKIQDLRRYHKVVHPDWILESVKAGRLLPVESFLVYRSGALDPSQRMLAFGTHPGSSSAASASASSLAAVAAVSVVSTSPAESVPHGAHRFASPKAPVPPAAESGSPIIGSDNVDSERSSSRSPVAQGGDSLPANATVTAGGVVSGAAVTAPAAAASGLVPSAAATAAATAATGPAPLANNASALTHSTSSSSAGFVSGTSGSSGGAVGGLAQRLDPLNPAPFIRQYFGASRLHHLSTWKMQLRQYTADLLAQKRAGTLQLDPIPVELRTPPPGSGSPPRTIIHVDMDCFFVSVAVRDRPELRGRPVAVSHGSKHGPSGEIAAASYEARAKGVKAGMWMGSVRELCPEVVILPYEFEKYEQVSRQIYRIFVRYSDSIDALSCDEALLDVTGLNGELTAQRIRADIFRETGCTASAAYNVMLAKIAVARGKPNGQYCIDAAQAPAILQSLPIRDLPFVGWSLGHTLSEMGIRTAGDLQQLSLERLQDAFGPKKGETLYRTARGLDDSGVDSEQTRKSLAVEINWGLRFQPQDPVEPFMDEVCKEVASRLQEVGMRGRALSVKVMRRKPGTEASKFLGHGPCDTFNKSVALHAPTDDAAVIARAVKRLYRELAVPPQDLRGFGVHVGRLQRVPPSKATPAAPAAPLAPSAGPAAPVGAAAVTGAHEAAVAPQAGLGCGDSAVVPGETRAVSVSARTGASVAIAPTHNVASATRPAAAVAAADVAARAHGAALVGSKRPASPEPQHTSALPNASQIDPSVLEHLPLDVLRELQFAYRMRGDDLPLVRPPAPPPAAKRRAVPASRRRKAPVTREADAPALSPARPALARSGAVTGVGLSAVRPAAPGSPRAAAPTAGVPSLAPVPAVAAAAAAAAAVRAVPEPARDEGITSPGRRAAERSPAARPRRRLRALSAAEASTGVCARAIVQPPAGLAELRAALLPVVSQVDPVHPALLELLYQALCGWLEAGQGDDVLFGLRALRRAASARLSVWRDPFNRLRDSVQNRVRRRFGAPLDVDPL